jgi:uncharacterized protein YecE (DUF72 family)
MGRVGKIHVGTSGWSYNHWKGPFYPENLPSGKFFSFYSKVFHTVEINSSFYHLPLTKTFEKWRDSSPPDFIFALKGSRFITHIKKLSDPAEPIKKFMERADGLAEKIGPILFQLPPSMKMDLDKLGNFVGELPRGFRFAFEFRNSSWFDSPVYSLLSDHGAAFCISELDKTISPMEVTADFVYVRLHGPSGPYKGRYSQEALKTWHEKFETWAHNSRDVYCYFDNDESGFAALNAREMLELVESK